MTQSTKILVAQMLGAKGNKHLMIATLLSLLAADNPVEQSLQQPIEDFARNESDTRAQALADIMRLFPDLQWAELGALTEGQTTKGGVGMVGMNLMPLDEKLFAHIQEYISAKCLIPVDKMKGLTEVGRWLMLIGAAAVLQMQQDERDAAAYAEFREREAIHNREGL